ncbi:hypothetical protein K0M31_016879 [Melipona bicolor]|uniref:Oxidoreductase FAD/NAD(P)-binding domain-containing protein n=1 Tax=Melipona bicolor TaxID=60889 RepID=A0AA40KEJ5_9HYME|nr:hypothetical protein K0M31_016879 [Melipona bicolor]
MEWKQTIESITFSYKAARDNSSLGYELSKLTNARVLFKIIFENEKIAHELNLKAEVERPPTWCRNFETMQVNNRIEEGILFIQHVDCQAEFTKWEKRLWMNYGYQATDVAGASGIVRVYRKYQRRKNTSRSCIPVPPCLHSDDMAPNYITNYLCFMIKKYPNGVLSPSITALLVGPTLEQFCRKTINLLNFNKDGESMFYVQQLERVSGEKLEVTHILSQPKSTWTGRRGMVSDELLNELIGKNNPDACVFICGPRLFLQAART